MKKVRARYRTAIGLEYDGVEQDTPIVSVRGEQLSADEIVKIAERFGIPVVERPDLIDALKMLEIDQPIPQELFEAVAVLLNQIENRLSNKARR